MSKLDYTRDYYADLELSGRTDDIDLIKKQYRKLSLKKHPDRPGGSNEEFNIISQAHVVLIDPEQKAKYDNHRSRTTRASGVRGNPWQNAGKEWAPPPRHPAFAQRATPSTQKRQSATSNADRFADFTASVPRRSAGKKAESSHTWQAWEDMRSGPKSKAGGQTAASGASARPSGASRASSYAAPPPPPVPPRPSPQKQPKGAFGTRVQRGGYVPESPGDEPSVTNNNYFTTRTHTNLFNETSSAARARRRAPSDTKRDSTWVDSRQSTPYQTQGGEKFDPWNGASKIGRSRSTRDSNRRSYDDEDEAAAYASARQRSASVPDDSDNGPQAGQGGDEGSDGQQSAGSTTANSEYQSPQDGSKDGGATNGKDSPKFFGSQFAGDSFANDSHRFSRNSTDNINTRFVAEEDATNWQFNAGSPVGETGRPAMPRSKSGSRVGRGSPFNSQTSQTPFAGPTDGGNKAQNGSFNPEEWSEKIGPQIFEAPAAQKTSVSTSRPIRNPSKKTKPVRMTAGTAGMVESDESSSGQDDTLRGQAAPGRGHGVDGAASPNAMDVDPPLATPAENGVRNIPVTPSRPEWRAGDLGLGIKVEAKPTAGQQAGFNQPAGGSEDSEEFRASFADLRNVEPFAERATGLESFGDLKSNLPFPSTASGFIPARKPVPKTHNFALPDPPRPPTAPPALAVPNLRPSAVSWKTYVQQYSKYMDEFSLYNAMFIDHFVARKIQLHEKLGNPAWLESRDNSGIQHYMSWAEQDREVRAKWTEACNNHEMNVRLFNAHREKMMK